MNREEVAHLISLGLDDELDSHDGDRLAAALSAHPPYRQLQSALIKQKARCKSPVPLPSNQLYLKTLDRVSLAYPPQHLKSKPRWHGLMAVAALILFAFLAGYFAAHKPSPANLAPKPNVGDHILQAKSEYLIAIEQLERLAQPHIDQMPSAVAFQVTENLKIIDRAIRACEDFAQAYPNYYVAYASLAKAYQAKVNLLQTLTNTPMIKS